MIMKDEADNEKLLTMYLLGSLPEEQRFAEKRSFSATIIATNGFWR